jgi:hypothetical protein
MADLWLVLMLRDGNWGSHSPALASFMFCRLLLDVLMRNPSQMQAKQIKMPRELKLAMWKKV